MESIKNAKFGTLSRSEMGKLVGGTNTTKTTDKNQWNGVTYSADCVTTDNNGKLVEATRYSYDTDSAAGAEGCRHR